MRGNGDGWDVVVDARSDSPTFGVWRATVLDDETFRHLYVPAAVSGRRAALDGHAAARAKSRWVGRVRQAWGQVSVEHVDAEGVAQEPQIGDELTVCAYVSLGSLSPEDVCAEIGYGRVSETDHIHERKYAGLSPVGDLGGGRHKFCGTITVDRSGPFGYTVRVLPAHPERADKAELGLVTNA